MDRKVIKATLDGRTVEITTYIEYGGAWARAVLDGKVVGSGKPGVIPAVPGHPEFTHGLGRVALTTAEYDAVMDLLGDAQAEFDATPEGVQAKLRREREALVNLVNARSAGADERRAESFDQGRLADYFQREHGEDETAVAQARAQLAIFDREHPEILAEVQADLRRRADRAFDA